MKFNRQALLTAVESAIESEHQLIEDQYNKAVQQYEDAKRDWVAGPNPKKLRDAAAKVIDLIDAGQVVLYDDMKILNDDGYRSNRRYFTWDEPKKSDTCSPRITRLESLRDFLELVTDDEVSTNGLVESGFRNIGSILNQVECK